MAKKKAVAQKGKTAGDPMRIVCRAKAHRGKSIFICSLAMSSHHGAPYVHVDARGARWQHGVNGIVWLEWPAMMARCEDCANIKKSRQRGACHKHGGIMAKPVVWKMSVIVRSQPNAVDEIQRQKGQCLKPAQAPSTVRGMESSAFHGLYHTVGCQGETCLPGCEVRIERERLLEQVIVVQPINECVSTDDAIQRIKKLIGEADKLGSQLGIAGLPGKDGTALRTDLFKASGVLLGAALSMQAALKVLR
jgi:hypothetical protein